MFSFSSLIRSIPSLNFVTYWVYFSSIIFTVFKIHKSLLIISPFWYFFSKNALLMHLAIFRLASFNLEIKIYMNLLTKLTASGDKLTLPLVLKTANRMIFNLLFISSMCYILILSGFGKSAILLFLTIVLRSNVVDGVRFLFSWTISEIVSATNYSSQKSVSTLEITNKVEFMTN